MSCGAGAFMRGRVVGACRSRRRRHSTLLVVSLAIVAGVMSHAGAASAYGSDYYYYHHGSDQNAAPAAADVPRQMVLLPGELATYVDANGVYTITGNVKNGYPWDARPLLSLHVSDGPRAYEVGVPYGAIPAGGELPFKVKVPYASPHAELAGYDMTSAAGVARTVTLDVLYDHTLVVHPGGHLSGFAVNSGNSTLEDPVLWAVVHGDTAVLDAARSEPLGAVVPGQTVSFEMRADPSISGVSYYSCFAPSSDSVHPLTAQRGDQKYLMRYESGAWLYRPVFAEDGLSVEMQSTNSYPFETFATVEIPPVTRSESFEVYRNGEAINHTQRADDMGLWHVSFDVRGHSQDVFTIRGFEQGKTLPALLADYIRQDMWAWASGGAPDSTVYTSLLLLSEHSLLPEPLPPDEQAGPSIPDWVATLLMWWESGAVGDDDAMAALSHLMKTGLIRPG